MKADSHLTYVPAAIATAGELSRYDVYGPTPGRQLGWVAQTRQGWVAAVVDPAMTPARARTRWEAATALWGTSDA
jgi:hypothetical protein